MESPPSHFSAKTTWAWLAIGAAAASFAVGVAGHVSRETRASIYNNNTLCPPHHKDAVCGDQRNDVEKAERIAIVGYAGAVGFATTGIVLFATSSNPKQELRSWATPAEYGFTIDGRF